MNAIRMMTERVCISWQEEARHFAYLVQNIMIQGTPEDYVVELADARDAVRRAHEQARVRLERLIGVDAIVEQLT